MYSPMLLTQLTADWNQGAFISYIYPGAFGQLTGLWSCCVVATFAYTGVEMIGIAAHEVERQRETIPRAVRRVSKRIVIYYVGAVFALGLNVSVQDPLLKESVYAGNASVFILMIRRAGLPALASVMNAGALIAVLSIANADLYLTVLTLPIPTNIDIRAEHYTHLLGNTKRRKSSKDGCGLMFRYPVFAFLHFLGY